MGYIFRVAVFVTLLLAVAGAAALLASCQSPDRYYRDGRYDAGAGYCTEADAAAGACACGIESCDGY